MKKVTGFIFLITALFTQYSWSFDQSWNHQQDLEKRITGYRVNVPNFTFNAEVVDFRNGMAQFQFNHNTRVLTLDRGSVTLQSQFFTFNNETRPALGVPLEFNLDQRQKVGVTGKVEQGKFAFDSNVLDKYSVNVFYNRKILSRLSSGLNFYSERLPARNHMAYSSVSASLNHRTVTGINLNVSSSVSRTLGPAIYNQVIGATYCF